VEKLVQKKTDRRLRLLLILGLLAFILVWLEGTQLLEPHNHSVGSAPADLPAENVSFFSYAGHTLRGWFVPGQPGRGAVVLMHGVRADRTAMLGRAKFLHAAGYSVLLFDFQAHGESLGDAITYGHLESLDAIAAVKYLRLRAPRDRVAVLGISLGGAAAILAEPQLNADAYILESVFPTIEQATRNRLDERLGRSGKHLAPLLLWQLKPRLGFFPADLRPIEHLGKIKQPKFLIAGTDDQKTKLKESLAMYLAAAEPKQFWAIEGARHEDLHQFARAEYERRVLEFLQKNLR
jgi:alpha-beta hydrolase superfamily lysophospholipase